MTRYLAFFSLLVVLGWCGCLYTFSGSTLPSHLKTVEVPLFADQSLEPTIADEITRELSREIVTGNLLKVVERDGNAVINGTVTAYANEPYTFGASATRQVAVEQYVVRITVEVEFMDNKKGEPIYKGQVTGEGIYDLANQTEQDGKQAAIKELVQRIMANSVQGW
ncbi:MAG: LptE family protein [Chitinispirillaceae bacterium]|nr:LptE family protein [Chitinispirillaceae bacterium]